MALIPAGVLERVVAVADGGLMHNETRKEQVGPLCVDITEATVEQYGRCVVAGACSPPFDTFEAPTSWQFRGPQLQSPGLCNGLKADHKDHPENCITMQQASAYCKSAGKRLPTSSEWLWAGLSADNASRYPWGSAPPTGPCYLNKGVPDTSANTYAAPVKQTGTAPVGASPSGMSKFGLLDMLGNVAEYTEDVRSANAVYGVIVMGGSWYRQNGLHDDWHGYGVFDEKGRSPDVGVRCVRADSKPVDLAAKAAAEQAAERDAKAKETAAQEAAIAAPFLEAKKIGTPKAWADFLQAHPESKKAAEARSQLADALNQGKAITISVSSTGHADCINFDLAQSEMIAHVREVGNSWKFQCPKTAAFKWTFRNLTKAPLGVKAQALGQKFEFIAKGDATVSGTVSLPDGCRSREQLSSKPRYSRGAVTFSCSDRANVTDASLASAAP
jgi:formylglycine-generating enzyme required for sulfatase activity